MKVKLAIVVGVSKKYLPYSSELNIHKLWSPKLVKGPADYVKLPLFPWASHFTLIAYRALYWLVQGTDLSVISQSN